VASACDGQPGSRPVFLLPLSQPVSPDWTVNDQVCNSAANSGRLPGHFVAMLGYGPITPKDYLGPCLVPGRSIVLAVSGTQVAHDDTLWSGALDHAINTGVFGNEDPNGVDFVWTGFDELGNPIDSCAGWTNLGGFGYSGLFSS